MQNLSYDSAVSNDSVNLDTGLDKEFQKYLKLLHKEIRKSASLDTEI